MSTIYSDVTAEDTDVAAFLAAHPQTLNVYHLPAKMWVARQDNSIIAVMTLSLYPFPTIDLIAADLASRPFMRIAKLWYMAKAWLETHNVPIVAVVINNSLIHYQTILRRLGFKKIGDDFDEDGNSIDTIFGMRLTEAVHDSLNTIH